MFELIIMAVSHYEGGNMHFEKIQHFLIHFAALCYASAKPAHETGEHYAEKLELTTQRLS